LRKVAPVVFGTLREVWLHPERLPITRFNAEVSPHRVFETRRFTIEEFKRVRELVPGATINDAVLAVCGGALRRYLLTHDELPGPSLVSIAPVSIRNADATTRGGLSMLRVPLGTEIEDPVRRLRSVHHYTSKSDEIEQAVGAKELTDITKHAPAATLALSARLLAESSIGMGHDAPMASCTITNVPGPAIPLYFNGARMTYFSAIMPISDGMGLVFAVTSYDGKIIISPTSCREQIPDPEFFALCIRESFQEYLELANRVKPGRRKAVGKAKRAKAPVKAGKGKGATASRRKAA
jgi:diacylglycerol O-acyltransferase